MALFPRLVAPTSARRRTEPNRAPDRKQRDAPPPSCPRPPSRTRRPRPRSRAPPPARAGRSRSRRRRRAVRTRRPRRARDVARSRSVPALRTPSGRIGLVRQSDLDVLRVGRHARIRQARGRGGLDGDLHDARSPARPARRSWSSTAVSSSAIRALGGSSHSGSAIRSIFRRFSAARRSPLRCRGVKARQRSPPPPRRAPRPLPPSPRAGRSGATRCVPPRRPRSRGSRRRDGALGRVAGHRAARRGSRHACP